MSVRVGVQPVDDFAALGEAWRRLETRSHPSFFQSWTWIGCLAEERFPDPLLLQAERDGETVGLALFNRRRGRLHLAESGDAAIDRPFIEHNAPLAADSATAAELLRAASRLAGRFAGRLVLGGVPAPLLEAAGGVVLRRQVREAPFLDLDALRAAGSDLSAALSSNARYQIRRSDRLYAGAGRLELARAETPAERDAWLGDLMRLHDATWHRRGRAGAFATPFLRRFHHRLVERAMARGELDLLRITGEAGTVGLLYNFRLGRRVYAYQSGLDDPASRPHARPGLTCHALAIAHALARGDATYDFLAGDQRYKRSFADRQAALVWAELAHPASPAALATRLFDGIRSRLGRATRPGSLARPATSFGGSASRQPPDP
jgi:CelD/BcsL family acetyltransferase involved in cellulose biosynthesis